jgi:hypothetical protein
MPGGIGVHSFPNQAAIMPVIATQRNYTVQIALALVVVVFLVGGVTFVSQYQTIGSGTPVPLPTEQSAGKALELTFPVSIKKWEPKSEGEFEKEKPGHYDYWFENHNDVSLELGVLAKSCHCAEVALCVLEPSKLEQCKKWYYANACAETVSGCMGAWSTLAQTAVQTAGFDIPWQDTTPNAQKGFIVGPKSGGIVRINWGGKKAVRTADRLTVTLWTQATSGANRQRVGHVIELNLAFVPLMHIFPGTIDVGELSYGEEKIADFICWSSIQASFPLEVHAESPDPCITYTVERLSNDDCNQFARTDPEGRVRALIAYHLRFTVKERLSDTVQMELGPFHRRFILSGFPEDEQSMIFLTGTVRGEVIVGSEEDKGKISLGSFNARNGTNKVVRLTTLREGLDLVFDKMEPPSLDFIKVKYFRKVQSLGSNGQARWELAVEVPPGCPGGPLPEHSAIYLKSPGKTSRHIRIPISGMAFLQ